MLFEELGKKKRSSIMSAILVMAIGLVMIICPIRYIDSLIAALGYGLLIYAVVKMLDFVVGKKVLINYIYMAGALIVALLGIAVLVANNVLFVIALVFALYLIQDGLAGAFNSWMYAKRAGRKGWQVLVALSVVLILLGVILLYNPWWNVPAVMFDMIGVMMLISAAVSIVRLVIIWPIQEA